MTDSDTQQNLPAIPVHRTVELPVAEFEGETVRLMLGKIPKQNFQLEYGYQRGTHLKMELELRCRSVLVDEVSSGEHKGELYREHSFAVVEARIIAAYTQEEADALDPVGVGGGLAGPGEPEDQEMDERPEGESNEHGFPDF